MYPERKDDRDGPQTGAGHTAFRNTTAPDSLNLFMAGVFASGCPPIGSIQSFRSSTVIKRIFGGLSLENTELAAAREMRPMSDSFVRWDRNNCDVINLYFVGIVDTVVAR